ncbi:MAG: hypothetical protein EOR16_30240 [Mesorhizobium sp.]|uniref:hypothetical protein n=1 Tax=Mesorhizobium sp. TaxID=1871066 RepID=UPI000FE6BE50|nr:hypothetical protein [Mesorhizobium sp.]RWI50539.1 MAG: hypothetical protein EOR16_30240 [Mesorhizobium sp.]
MTEKSKKGGQVSKEAKATWHDLPNELRHEIIVHAITDRDAWKANENLTNVSGTSRHFRDLTRSKVVQEYKNNLDGGRLVSDTIIEAAFPNHNFSDNEILENDWHIGKEAAAVAPVLEFQSSRIRSAVFNRISEKDTEKRMLGYSYIADRADLFQKHEKSHMDSDALNAFREDDRSDEDNPPRVLTRYSAAAVLVKRYDDLSNEVRSQLEETLSNRENRHQRAVFSDAITNCNPSLLKYDRMRSLVRENLNDMEDPHAALAQLASYIDKNSRDDTNFIIEESLRRLGGVTVQGDEHGLNAPSRAIATVFEGNVSPEHKEKIAGLIQSNGEKGRALASAFKALEQGRLPEPSVETGMRGSAKLLREVTKIYKMPGADAFDRVGDVAKRTARQMNAAREDLMNSVRDRGARGR